MASNLNQIKFTKAGDEMLFRKKGYFRTPLLDVSLLSRIEFLYQKFSVEWKDTGFYSSMMIKDADYRKKVSEDLSDMVSLSLNSVIDNYEILFSNFLVKLPRPDNHLGMHQDWNFVDESQSESFNFWIPLEDVDDSNGNLFIVEESHQHFLHPRGTPYLNYFKNYEVDLEKVSTPLFPKKGELILYHGRSLHFSKPNLSGKARIAVGGVIIPKGEQTFHYRNNNDMPNLEWTRFAVDKLFFQSFTPEQGKIEGYKSERVVMRENYFSEEYRQELIQRFLKIKAKQ